MKFILMFVLLSLFSACNEFYELKDKDKNKNDEDGSIIGTVTYLLNPLAISSALAQTDAEIEHGELSVQLQSQDFFSLYSSGDYSDSVVSAKQQFDYYQTALQGIVSSNANQYTDTDFPFGIVFSMGFDQNKKLVSLLIAPVDANGKYSLQDSAYKNVSFYKLAFMLNAADLPIYRLSYIFRDGKRLEADVNYVTSVASVKLAEAMGVDADISLQTMKSKQADFETVVKKSLPDTEEESVLTVYTSNHYQIGLNPAQQFILQSALLHAMRANPAFKSALLLLRDPFYTYLSMARPGILADFCDSQGAAGEVLITNLDLVIDQLISIGLIPSRGLIFIPLEDLPVR